MADTQALTGTAVVRLYGPDGELKSEEITHNLITDVGDSYYATRGAAGVLPANSADVAALVDGMKLGSAGSATAPAKNGAGAALAGTYIAGSNLAFDSTYPQVVDNGAGAGEDIKYVVTFPAGTATDSSIDEAVIVTDAGTDATSAASETISRITFADVNKTSTDELVITWSHHFQGA